MSKHTPGPWSVDDNHGKRYIEPVASNEPVAIVCKVKGDTYAANAFLLAAAPELLDSLEQAVTSMQDHGWPNDHLAVRSARAAIAKARGPA